MATASHPLNSSIGKKVLMAGTGLFLCSFLVVHLVGHIPLLLPDGAQAYNEYTHFMSTNMLIRIMELGLVLGFLGHIIYGLRLSAQNNAARPVKYAVLKPQADRAWLARIMKWTGILVLLFLIIHLKTFWYEYKFGSPALVTYDGVQLKDMYTMVIDAFGSWYYSAFYVVCMLFLGYHLNHGFQSAFQTLGLNSSRHKVLIRRAGMIFAYAMGIGFAIFPAWIYIKSLM